VGIPLGSRCTALVTTTGVIPGSMSLNRWCSAVSQTQNPRVSTRGGSCADPRRWTPPTQHCTFMKMSLSVISYRFNDLLLP
jgi:hypothetical protein